MNFYFNIPVRKIIIFSFLCMIFLGSCVNGMEKSLIAEKNIITATPKTTVIAFDAHDVLLDFDKKALLGKIVQYSVLAGATTLAGTAVVGTSAVWLAAAIPTVIVSDVLGRILSFKKKYNRRPVIEHIWDADCLLKFLKPEYVRLESLFKPNDAMFALIDELKESGYGIALASNIAPETLKLLQARYPKYFEKIDFIESPDEENEWVDKKQPKKFFANLKKKAQGKQFILIDDKDENCKNAENEEIAAICFKGDMSELRMALQNNGVDVA